MPANTLPKPKKPTAAQIRRWEKYQVAADKPLCSLTEYELRDELCRAIDLIEQVDGAQWNLSDKIEKWRSR